MTMCAASNNNGSGRPDSAQRPILSGNDSFPERRLVQPLLDGVKCVAPVEREVDESDFDGNARRGIDFEVGENSA